MKSCPKCSKTFADDTSFCLEDGTPLAYLIDEPEPNTVVRTKPGIQPAVSSRKSLMPIFGCLGAGLIGVIVLGAVGLFFLLRQPASPGPANNAPSNSISNLTGPGNTFGNTASNRDSTNQQLANLRDQQSELDKEKQRLANERQTLEDQKKNTPPQTTAPPPKGDPPTGRITFHRGSVQETVSGSVTARRSYVLRTMAGQSLYGRVVSPGNCILFSNGSTNISFATVQGDSSITLINNCAHQTIFSLTVYVR